MSYPKIVLSQHDSDYGASVGCIRRGEAFIKGRDQDRPRVGYRQLLAEDILGARCELAAKRWLDPIPWNELLKDVNSSTPDLGDDIDVKGRSKIWYDLLVQKKAPDHFAYLLVFPNPHPTYCIRGWLWGHEAKVPEYWGDKAHNDRPAFFVPQGVLRHPDELFALVRQREVELA